MTRVREFLRARFSKQGDVRFISHRELLRLFEKALRRARLPMGMSRGYNPRPRISLPAPLSVGFIGRNEVFDFELNEWIRPEQVRRRLAEELPEGIELNSLQCLPAKPDRRVRELSYRVALDSGHPVRQGALAELLAADELIIQRFTGNKTKTVNIAPFVRMARLENGQLLMLLKVTDQGTARPEEVLEVLGCQCGTHYEIGAIERTHVSLSSSL